MSAKTIDYSYLSEGIIVWISCFVVADFLGMISTFSLIGLENSKILATVLYDAVVSLSRFAALYYFARIFGNSFSGIFYKKTNLRGAFIVVLMVLPIVIVNEIFFTSAVVGRWIPQLFELSFFIKRQILYGIIFRVLYYLSEIASLNYLYMLFSNGFRVNFKIIDGGMILLFLFWSLPQSVGAGMYVILYSFITIFILYTSYRLTKNPLTSLLLWIVAQTF